VAVVDAVVFAPAALATAGAMKADALMAAMTAPPVSNPRNLTVELPGRYYFARSLRAVRAFHKPLYRSSK
jgi:hypothetical protein